MPIRDQIRPFTRQIRPAADPPQPGLRRLRDDGRAASATRFGDLNTLFNTLAYKPEGPKESYLFYLPWLNHNFNSTYLTRTPRGRCAAA